MNKTTTWGEWLEDSIVKAEDFAKKAQLVAAAASKIAQDGAVELGKQAKELRDKYDLDATTNALMTTIGGGVVDSTRCNRSHSRKSVLDLVYVTENLISMSFPYDFKKNGRRSGGQEGNDINIVSKFLKQKHGSHFMIWNVSEETYDYSLFGDQVLEYSFPGHPAPPLGLLFKICMSVESWLDADEKNVAVVHCITGKGRTAALMSCILTWIGEFNSPLDALQYVAERRGVSVDYLTIPSQRRYVQYFTSLLAGAKPLSAPLVLMRIIMNTIPNFSSNSRLYGCCPYIQIFQCGKLIATAAPPGDDKNESSKSGRLALKWMNSSDGSVSFVLDCAVRGDLLLRCRHADPSGARVSIFRAAIHTGYIPASSILRLLKADLDGACSDSKFEEDFFIDLIFSPMTYAKNENENEKNEKNGNIIENNGNDENNVGESIEVNDTKLAEVVTVVAVEVNKGDMSNSLPNSTVAPVLSRPVQDKDTDKDTDLWDAVLAKQSKSKKRVSRRYVTNRKDQFSISDEVDRSASNDSTEINNAPTVPSVSNEDLIMQIARLELDQEKGEEKDDREKTTEDRVTTDENEDGNGNTMEDYDEDYYVSLDDIYPQENDFVTINNMTGEYNNTASDPSGNTGNPIAHPMKAPMEYPIINPTGVNPLGGGNPMLGNPMGGNPMNMSPEKSEIPSGSIGNYENENEKNSKNEKKMKKDGKDNKELDDFRHFLESSLSSPPVRDESGGQIKSPDGGSGVIVSPIKSVISSNSVNNIGNKEEGVTGGVGGGKGKNDDNDELDELERYLLNLNG